MLKPRSWHSQTSILHTSVLYVGCVVTTLAGWSKTQTSNLGGKREREGQIVASLCVAILHLHCQKLPLVSKYHIYLFQCENVQYPTPLCQQHYHFVYETLQPKYTHCCTCNSSLRNSQKRICPNREVIQEYLTENTGFDGTIPEDGRVC